MSKELKHNYFEKCPGCPEGHSSFWRTVIMSPQWQSWIKEQQFRLRLLNRDELPEKVIVYDIDECQECGWISAEHFQDFIKFCKSL